ncbi:putative pre-mRNA-splicing factor 18 [Triangularia verruculosa]|uniref:Pre-mRNA-splicing factor 18 n=1 Tax=Triangularia verruculosa TaxID=2587418 RepID=A0AAN7AT20_9PEZI|nr:putative pre-mRNA-splicing factor 18 [Triangularia verruculosa]
MDFASLMAKEIAKKEPEKEKPQKYISRREAEVQREAAYLASQKTLEEERASKAAAKRKREEDAAEEAKAREEKRRKLAEESRLRREAKQAEEERARRKRLGLPELPPPNPNSDSASKPDDSDNNSDTSDSDSPNIPDPDLKSKLRQLGHPAVLFGESHLSRLRRYRNATRPSHDLTTAGPIQTKLLPVEEKDMKVPDKIPPATEKKARKYLYRQLASYFNMILREWEAALARENNADTTAGQQAINAMTSSKENMAPLFRLFEKGELDESILEAVVEIVKAAQEKRYVDANDGYLRLSIGKAAWPIGVTMVGIHERSAREKLHNGERGHIMGSEVTRKYLQSIKRCLTFAQVRWPPEDIRQLMG